MTFILWLCIVTPSGTCGVEKSVAYATLAACERALERAHLGMPVNVAVGSSTAVDINAPRVVALCKPGK